MNKLVYAIAIAAEPLGDKIKRHALKSVSNKRFSLKWRQRVLDKADQQSPRLLPFQTPLGFWSISRPDRHIFAKTRTIHDRLSPAPLSKLPKSDANSDRIGPCRKFALATKLFEFRLDEDNGLLGAVLSRLMQIVAER